MARYFSRQIQDVSLPKPPVGPLTGLKVMAKARAAAVLNAQDQVIGLSRRVLMRHGLAGESSSWLTPNTDPEDAAPATRTYPDSSTWRVVGRWKGEITPGSFVKMIVSALPSGETQRSDGAAGFESSGASGAVRASIKWTDADAGGVVTTNTDVSIPASTLEFAGTGTDAGDGWGDLQKHESILIYPDETLTDNTKLRQYTRAPVTLEITLQHQAGARAVDVCVYELPTGLCVEADDDGDEWVSQMWQTTPPGAGAGPRYPLQHKVDPVDGDPRGMHRLLEVHAAQAARLGPTLFSWSGWLESDSDPADIEELGSSTSSATYVHLCDSSITEWAANEPGWSMSAGGNARNQADNGDWVMRDRTASVPVRVQIYGFCGGQEVPGVGSVRLQTGPHSYMDCPVTNGAAAWSDHYGHLECGLGPEQPIVVVPFAKIESGEEMTIYSICAYVTRSGLASSGV